MKKILIISLLVSAFTAGALPDERTSFVEVGYIASFNSGPNNYNFSGACYQSGCIPSQSLSRQKNIGQGFKIGAGGTIYKSDGLYTEALVEVFKTPRINYNYKESGVNYPSEFSSWGGNVLIGGGLPLTSHIMLKGYSGLAMISQNFKITEGGCANNQTSSLGFALRGGIAYEISNQLQIGLLQNYIIGKGLSDQDLFYSKGTFRQLDTSIMLYYYF